MANVLVVDDDQAIRELVSAYLARDGHEVLEAADGNEALRLAPRADVVVLDLMLPGIDGFEVAQVVRRDYPQTPILMLTARSREDDRITGLDLGADDYVTKPFSPRELAARVRALIRRSGGRNELRFNELFIDPVRGEVRLQNRKVQLTQMEYNLLLTLAQHAGMTFSRDRLLERVWGAGYPGIDRVVDVHIAALRRKLADDAEHPAYIETVRGTGYRFKD